MVQDPSPSEAPLGSPERPVRVAVIGAGPAGFFTAEALLRSAGPVFEVHVIERLPTPFGLVRAGVAPDHQKIKSVTRTFDKTAGNQRFRFLGNCLVGQHLSHAELLERYHQVVYAIGSSADRRLGIPGEELDGCHAATAFVGWYNAHPDFRDFPFDLNTERAVVVGVGNVAIDVARVLLRDRDQLGRTDISSAALARLRASPLREVVMLARRGPAQVAFTPGELLDVAELDGVTVQVDGDEVERELGRVAAAGEAVDPMVRKNLELMQSLARSQEKPGARVLRLQFRASPRELLGDERRRVRAVVVEENELVHGPGGPRARGTGRTHALEAGLVFRSVGYFGVPVPGVPFDDKAGVIPNVDGRVQSTPGGPLLGRTYAVGWIRRGPLGVIGTNKADAQAVVEKMIEDVPGLGAAFAAVPSLASPASIDALLTERGVRVTSYDDWRVIDRHEVAEGSQRGKVREKFSSVEEMMNRLLRQQQ